MQHIHNLEDLGDIAKLMGFTQDGVNSIEEVGTKRSLNMLGLLISTMLHVNRAAFHSLKA